MKRKKLKLKIMFSIKTIIIVLFLLLMVVIKIHNNKVLKNSDTLLVAIVASSGDVNGKNIYNLMQTSTIANSDIVIINDLSEDLSNYDVLYIDKSVIEISNFDYKKIQEYVNNGGNVFLDNALYNQFDKEFIGAKEFVSLNDCPTDMEYPKVSNELYKLQELIKDFSYIYKGYKNYSILSNKNYGVGVINDTAISIAMIDNVSIYTLNKYGDGFVFFSNPLLPNIFSVNNLSDEDYGEYLSITTVGANKLIRDYFLEFISINKYGYAIEHVYGSFGTPAASWQLHYEDIRGIKNSSSIIFSKLLEENGQVASFTLARNPYTWFKRSESVTYALSNGVNFVIDPYENVLSSGTHFVSDDKWLELSYYDNTIGYFEDSKDYIKRAYPCPIDLNKDNKMDLIVGSSDGKFYYFQGYGIKSNYELESSKLLMDENRDPISVDAYSSPTLGDIDQDGTDEIITGNEDGIIRYFKHIKGLYFKDMGILVKTNMKDSMPSIGDLNNDGIIDMAVGSRHGNLKIYYGNIENGTIKFDNYEKVLTEESWISPSISDLNNDGVDELFAGNQDGYIVRFKHKDEKFYFDGYFENNKYNYKGNKFIKFGNNSIIRFYDINSDGNLDIVAGSLEYGMAIPIDSDYFPYKEKLQEQIDYLKEKDIYIGVHMLSSKYSSIEDDKIELGFHKKAFNSYNISWDKIGVNQHTWNTSSLSENKESFSGTYSSQVEYELLWNNGSRTPNATYDPENSAEDTLTIPFYLNNGQLIMQPSNILHGSEEYSNISIKYEVPLLFYYHCDFAYEQDDLQYELINKVSKLLENNNYKLVQEDQLANIVAASYNTKVISKYDEGTLILSSEIKDKKTALYNKNYQKSTGVKIIFSDEVDVDDFYIDANVYYKKDNAIYLSLDEVAKISREKHSNKIHIVSVNLPAKIFRGEDNAKIEFLDGGMMEITVEGNYTTNNKDWIIEKKDGLTTFRKYGKPSTLKIQLI